MLSRKNKFQKPMLVDKLLKIAQLTCVIADDINALQV